MLLNILLMTCYTHLFAAIYRKAVLPIEAELGNSKTSESESDDGACISQYIVKMSLETSCSVKQRGTLTMLSSDRIVTMIGNMPSARER